MSMSRLAAASLLVMLAAAPAIHAQEERTATVGMRARIMQLVLPGTELLAKPAAGLDAPFVLRIVETFPHGTAFRYDLEYYGLEPGKYDLRDHMLRKDGSSTADLPPIEVEISAVLPPGQIEPKPLETERPPDLGGYRLLGTLAIIAWIGGLLAILLVGRNKRHEDEVVEARPRSLAERLRPMVESATRAQLDDAGKAELERLLLAYWRKRLGLGDEKAAQAIIALRQHAEAGELLRELESWLHSPQPPENVDLTALLAPYRDVPADIVEERAPVEVS